MRRQRGSVLIVTLWTVTLMIILVTVIASNVRLSARAALRQQEELTNWANIVQAVNHAEMELMMERMPEPLRTIENPSELNRTPVFRFNGQPLSLQYPVAEGITVRIYDHAGKINIREMGRPRMRAILEKRLGRDRNNEIDALIAAWADWLDLNRQPGPAGAEDEYYLALDPPYIPRNGKLETVEELLAIRGFAEVFEGINLEAAFTLYSGDDLININLATREALELLPGLDEESIEAILAWRQDNEFVTNVDVGMFVQAEKMIELNPWINNRKTSNFYTIVAYQTITADAEDAEGFLLEDLVTHAYSEIVQIDNFNDKPRVLRVNPYERLPARDLILAEEWQ